MEPIVAQSIQPRRRIGLEISTKGVITWSVTVEMYGDHVDEILKETDNLVAEMKLRYPVKE